MTSIPQPGVSEVGWLADLKETAEKVGAEIYGEPIRWEVEALPASTRKRPDVVVRRDATGEVLGSGEAKRPDAEKGVHPLVASEVEDAIKKARILGAPLCFTTNFFDSAVFDATDGTFATDLDRLQGGTIALLPDTLAKAQGWWAALSTAARAAAAEPGLRRLLERIRASAAAPIPRDVDEAALLVFSRTTERLVAPLFDNLIAQRSDNFVPAELVHHALTVNLTLSDDSQARYLVAQGVAEVLTACLFYRNISEHFSLGDLLRGTNPKKTNTLSKRIKQSLQEAMTLSGDYETIFRLSPAAEWVLLNGGAPVLQHWKDLLGFIEQLDFTSTSTDVVGSIFERLISPERRHAMGQHYTSPRIARAMSRWAVRGPADRVADVACGAGTFLVEAYGRLKEFGLTHRAICEQLLGNDIDHFAVHLATMNVATRDIYRGSNYPAVRLGDAFEILPGASFLRVNEAGGGGAQVVWPEGGVEAIVGNPPYARSPGDAAHLRVCLGRLGLSTPQGMNGGNLAAWFAFLAAALLRSGGRFALVLPTGVLQNDNLRTWRSWLRRSFDLVVWHTEDDVWFSDARVAVCVVLANPPSGDSPKLHFVDVTGRSDGALLNIEGIPSPSPEASPRDLSAIPPDADILIAGTYPSALKAFRLSKNVRLLESLAGVQVFSGNKLGHECFQLRDQALNKAGVLRTLEGYKMELKLNVKYLTPLFVSPKDERTGEFRGSTTWVLKAPERLPARGAVQSYVSHCEKLGVHEKPTMRSRRQPWWSAEWRESQLAVQIHPGFLHQVWWSGSPFVAKNNFHTLAFDEHLVQQRDRELIAASIASGFGALAALYISSEVGCEGVRWLSTDQLKRWPVLDPAKISGKDKEEILKAYRVFRKYEAKEIHLMDPEALSAWTEVTTRVAKAARLAQPKKVAKEVIEAARRTCVRRTGRETMALAGRRRGAGGSARTFRLQIESRLEGTPTEMTPILEELTCGEDQIKLRDAAELKQETFDLGTASVHAFPGEEELSEVLGEGFECAPQVDPDEPAKLASRIVALQQELGAELLGPAPEAGDPAYSAYSENSKELRRTIRQWLQREVRARLA